MISDVATPADPAPALPHEPRVTPGGKWVMPVLIAVVLLTFVPVLRNDFVNWDDLRTIRDNPRISQPSVANALYYWRHPHMGLYVPVTYTVWSVISSMAQ